MERFLERMDRDRRLSRRHSLRAPLRIRVRKSDVAERCAESENLSRRGVYFATDLPLNKGASLDLLLEMPEEISGVPPTGCAPVMSCALCRRLPRAKNKGSACNSTFTKCHARSVRNGPWAPVCEVRCFPWWNVDARTLSGPITA